MAEKGFSIRIDEEILNKLHYVSEYEARSMNSQIVYLIRMCIKEFENKNGEIEELLRKRNDKNKKG